MSPSPSQSKHDLYTFGETIKDYIALLGAIRVRTGVRGEVEEEEEGERKERVKGGGGRGEQTLLALTPPLLLLGCL